MDYLKKASNPKIVSIVGIVTGVCVAVIYFIIRNIGLGGTAALLRGNTSGMGFIKPLYYLAIVGGIVGCALSVYRFIENKTNRVAITNAVINGIIAILLIMSHTIISIFTNYADGNLSGIYGLSKTVSYSDILNQGRYVSFAFYLSLILIVYNILILLVNMGKLDIPHLRQPDFNVNTSGGQAMFDPVTGQPINMQNNTNNVFDSTNTNSFNGGNTGGFNTSSQGDFNANAGGFNASSQGNFNDYNNTANSFDTGKNNSKTVKVVVIVLLVAALLFGAYKAYGYFFGGTKIDLAKNITLKFFGESGQGRIIGITNNIDYDKSDSKLYSFVSSLRYTYDKQSGLSNGDKIKVTVIYDKDQANKLGLKITSSEKTVEVKDLLTRFASAKDVPQDLVTSYRTIADQKINGTFTSGTVFDYKSTFESVWFQRSTASASSIYQDRVVYVYKVAVTSKTTNTVFNYYYSVTFNGVNSGYKTASKYASVIRLYDSSTYQSITDASQIEKALTNNNYTASKIG
ncbi:hypothetical protein [Eggerthia catenaformis]|uniref:hypothetical protein n=1 Tax=Eggerthia catenaformis TaxID=31973 RepID=UPI00047AA706|nr:hypothetical protein [Eggerthia catenaformis]